MATKLFGIKTGSIDTFTNSGQKVKWSPRGELTLVSSADAPLVHGNFRFPRTIAANPDRHQARGDLHKIQRGEKSDIKEAARLFVGFNVGTDEVWRAGEAYLAAYLLREEQLAESGAAPGFSFYVGLGAFPGNLKTVISERSAQLVFINFGQDRDKFTDDMIDLAADLAEMLSQEAVLLELQEDGKVVYLDYIDVRKKDWWSAAKVVGELEENKHRISKSVWNME